MRKRDKRVLITIIVSLLLYLGWRMVRPLEIFVVNDRFATPIAVTAPPPGLLTLRASECGTCHQAIYREWSQSMHAKAWTDPYFQTDRDFEDAKQICLNCHTPLQNQQEHLVTGFRDSERLDPILEANPDFSPELRQEGVTCAVCHVREGYIIGPYGDTSAPHPSRYDPAMRDGVEVCRRCHVAIDRRWDVFYRIPVCGTVAEIREGQPGKPINCVKCHMPETTRPMTAEGVKREGRQHLWKGGHDIETVRQALRFELNLSQEEGGEATAQVTLTNIGTEHYLPTGIPDRHLTVEFLIRDGQERVLEKQTDILKRWIMWRPFIVDLWDDRLPANQPRDYSFHYSPDDYPAAATLEVTVRYHLLDEARRRRIGYDNREPIAYILYQERRALR